LSDAEETRLRTAIESRFPEYLPHLLLSIHSGMRMSEQYGLRWCQVDFNRRQIHLPKTKMEPPNDSAERGRSGCLDATSGEAKKPGTTPVSPSLRGSETLRGPRGWFSTALEEAKIEGYSWHCNRHTFASRLVMAGVDLRTVAELLGHGTLQMVMRYSHLAPAH
jgi:integrase